VALTFPARVTRCNTRAGSFQYSFGVLISRSLLIFIPFFARKNIVRSTVNPAVIADGKNTFS
jgi:hypothetical protein